MSFEKKLDDALDNLGESAGDKLASFAEKSAKPFFTAVTAGIKEWYHKRIWKTKSFKLKVGILVLVAVISSVIERFYAPHLYAQHPVWYWLYNRQKLMPVPITFLFSIIVILKYYQGLGKEILALREKFILAFERSGLYSKKKITTKDGLQPEYPFLIKDGETKDGERFFIFKNPGLPLENWISARLYIEATLEKEISSIEHFNKNPGRVIIKLGESSMPEYVEVSEDLLKVAAKSSVVVGVSSGGAVTHNFQSVPHIVVGGATGAGKTVVASFIAYQYIKYLDGLLYIIDFKGGADYTAFEELGIDPIFERQEVVNLFKRLHPEHVARMRLFKSTGVKNLEEYNAKFPDEKLRRIGVLVDELAELTDPKSVPKSEHELLDIILGQMSTAARLYRSSGINLILATQRPDANVIPGQIKNNVPGRLCGFFNDDVAYRIVLDFVPHPRLPDPETQPGRFIYSLGSKHYMVQVPHFKDKHIDSNIKMDYETGVLTLNNDSLTEISPVPSRKNKYHNLEAN